jgi:hypothetical protein
MGEKATSSPYVAKVASLTIGSCILFTVAHLLMQAVFVSAAAFSEGRYLSVLLPAVLVASAIALENLWNYFVKSRKKTIKITICVFICGAAFFEATGIVVDHNVWRLDLGKRVDIVRNVLEKAAAERLTLRDLLATNLNENQPILTSYPHEVYLLIGRNTVGLTEAWYTKTVWDETKTLQLCERFGIKRILIIGDSFESGLVSNQVLFEELMKKSEHPRLKQIAEVQGGKLFEIQRE